MLVLGTALLMLGTASFVLAAVRQAGARTGKEIPYLSGPEAVTDKGAVPFFLGGVAMVVLGEIVLIPNLTSSAPWAGPTLLFVSVLPAAWLRVSHNLAVRRDNAKREE